MTEAESDANLEREDTNISENPSTFESKSKKNKSRKSSPIAGLPNSPENPPRSSCSEALLDGKKKRKQGPIPPGSHKVTFTVTIAKAIPNGK